MAHWFDIIHEPPVEFGVDRYSLPTRVSIETCSACNRRCSFCPAGRKPVKNELMTDEVFNSVVAALADVKFDGVVQMFLENEPLLDPELLNRANAIREACPRCTIYVSTNFDVMSHDPVHWLCRMRAAGITTINMNAYPSGPDHWELIQATVKEALTCGFEFADNKYRRKNPKRCYVVGEDMRNPTGLVNKIWARGERVVPTHKRCGRVFRQLGVMWDGRVPCCPCTDPRADWVPKVGQLPQDYLWDLWNSEQMFKMRYFLQQGRRAVEPCMTCDGTMAYSHVVRRVTAAEDTVRRWEDEAENSNAGR